MMIRGQHISGLDEPGGCPRGLRAARHPPSHSLGCRSRGVQSRPTREALPAAAANATGSLPAARRRGCDDDAAADFPSTRPTSQSSLLRAAASAGDAPRGGSAAPAWGASKYGQSDPPPATPCRADSVGQAPAILAPGTAVNRGCDSVAGSIGAPRPHRERPLERKVSRTLLLLPSACALPLRVRLGARRATCVRAGSRDCRRCYKRPPAGHSYLAGRPQRSRPAGLSAGDSTGRSRWQAAAGGRAAPGPRRRATAGNDGVRIEPGGPGHQA